MLISKLRVYLFLISLGFLGACSEESGTQVSGDFDRVAMLGNIANNIIRPSYADLQTKANNLLNATDAFVLDANAATLQAAQTAWTETYQSWQKATPFNFGPGGTASDRPLGTLRQTIGIFPVNTTQIEENITNLVTDLNTRFASEKGFLAVEYMLFEKQGANSVLDVYAGDASARFAYLQALVTEIRDEIEATNTGWTSYEATFLSNGGTDFGSGTSQLYNAFVESYEELKNFKVGLPAGQRPEQTSTEPTRVEAFYSGISLGLIKEHFNTIEDIWLGQSETAGDAIGFEEYLMAVEGGPALVESTRTQITAARNALNNIPDGELSEIIQNSPETVIQAHTELQKLTRFFKSDMSSLLGLSITFNSGDGD